MRAYGIWVALWFVSVARYRRVAADTLPACQPSDFHYEYTECDSEGGRWRVSVPKPNTCTGGAPNAPVRGKDCNFQCDAGQYLDLSGNQECQNCPAGTYSLGGGERFDYWDELPASFSVTSDGLERGFFWHSPSRTDSTNCTKSMWKPRGGYVYAAPAPCTTTLTHTVKLVKAGRVMFEYQHPDQDTIFHFIVQNDQCLAAEAENGAWPDVTEEGKWGSVSLPLKSGMNVLQWRVIGALSDMVHSQKPVLIRKIEVTGIAFTSECTKCRAGTYSSGGTAFCAPCEANQYSGRGATQCQNCKNNEYSERGSLTCSPRPPCTPFDYYEFQTPCDNNKKTQKTYKWIEPRICDYQASGSVPLPPNTPMEDCPPCNPGMYPVNASLCEFCPEGHYSGGGLECKECPVSTSPEYGIDYRWWTVMPPNITSHCIDIGMHGCSKDSGWLPASDQIRTNYGPKDRNTFLVLTLHIDGFRGESSVAVGKSAVFGQVRFTFEINCTEDCEMVFLTDETGRNTVVQSWTGSVPRQEFKYDVHTNTPLTVSWAFQPVSSDVGDLGYGEEDGSTGDSPKKAKFSSVGMDSVAKIFALKVTNTLGGGATRCLSCPKGTTENGCVPCPDGQYVNPTTIRCHDCPKDTVLPSSNSWGQDSCRTCGEGLKAIQRRVCKSDCTFTDKAGRNYDFTALDGVHYVQGGRLFTSSGTMYYHGFNLTLCNANDGEMPICHNNVTSDSQVLNMPTTVSAMVCRATLIPQSDVKKPLVSTQPVVLATELTKIETNISMDETYTTEGFDAEGSQLDVHFYYKSETPTMACPEGRTTIISLRCDPDEKSNSSIQLPPKCSDGTCDGCTFHFLWRTQHACPRCKMEDYEVIRGECVNGEQLIHYYPPAYCLPIEDKEVKPMKQKCQVLPFAIMIAIPVALGVGLLLILTLIYCWSRNKKLAYKYSKLVESAGGRDGELPGVESCGMEEGEEDDAVHFADNSGPRLLQKIRLKISGVKNKFTMERLSDDDNPFMAVQMHEKLPLT